jgi:hypothetical protein
MRHMGTSVTRLPQRAIRLLGRERSEPAREACTWDALRAVYEEQAARGVPEAIVGLERMNAGCWPSDGAPRTRRS